MQPAALATATAPMQAGGLAAGPGTTLLRIDPAASRIELRLRAAGPLAALGHNHVIVARGLAGEAQLGRLPAATRGELRIAVDALSVDDPAERSAAGGEFAAPIPEAARRGTRAHMLGRGQLEAGRFPGIVLRWSALRVLHGDAIAGDGELDTELWLLGRRVPLVVPARWQRSAQGLAVQGELQLRQGSLGIQPYSVGAGALRVADEVEVSYALSLR